MTKNKVFGVIMAGGGGTRFWPLSRTAYPKQLLNLSGKDVMVNETADRLKKVCDRDDLYVVTNKVQADKIKELSSGKIPFSNVLKEPAMRNTSACIGFSAVKIYKEKGDGVMIVSPSDAYIKDTEEFARVLALATKTAYETDKIVTIGITPTYPATGYGYINYEKCEGEVKTVNRFVEKPDAVTAERYIKEGGYVWNSGIFVFKISVILKEFEKFLPDVYQDLLKIMDAVGTKDEEDVVAKVYPEIRSVSVDYGIMEKTDGIKVIPAEFGWSDVGSLDALEVLHKADENGNVKVGDVIAVDSKNCIAYSSNRTLTVLGMEGIIAVETPDAILICPKDKAQEVKKIVEELKKSGKENLL